MYSTKALRRNHDVGVNKLLTIILFHRGCIPGTFLWGLPAPKPRGPFNGGFTPGPRPTFSLVGKVGKSTPAPFGLDSRFCPIGRLQKSPAQPLRHRGRASSRSIQHDKKHLSARGATAEAKHPPHRLRGASRSAVFQWLLGTLPDTVRLDK